MAALSGEIELWVYSTPQISSLSNDTIYEPCEGGPKGCNVDQRSFKAYFSRWLADTAILAPFTHDIIMPKLAKGATAAIKVCNGGDTGTHVDKDGELE